jgi:hypothetical protein
MGAARRREGSYRFLRTRVPGALASGSRLRAGGRSRRRREQQTGGGACAWESTVFKQVDYDYRRMQCNTVILGAMKMLSKLDDLNLMVRRRLR